MLLTLFFSLYALLIRNKISVAFYLSILIIASSVAGLLVNNEPVIEDLESILNVIFTEDKRLVYMSRQVIPGFKEQKKSIP